MTYKFTEEAIKDKFALVSEYTREVILNKINEEVNERGPSSIYFIQVVGEYLAFNNRGLNGLPVTSVKFFVNHGDLEDIPEPLKELEAGIWIDVGDLKNYELSEAISKGYTVIALRSDDEHRGVFMTNDFNYIVGSLLKSEVLEFLDLEGVYHDLYAFDHVMFIPTAETKEE